MRLARKHTIQEIKNKRNISEKIKEIQNYEIHNIQVDDELKSLDDELSTVQLKLKAKKTIEKEVKTKVILLCSNIYIHM